MIIDKKTAKENQVLMHQNYFDSANSAIDGQYYLEAILREYAAIEGRLEVMCGVLGLPCNKESDDNTRKNIKISHRVHCIEIIYDDNHLYGRGSFRKETFDTLKDWLYKRNTCVHGLYKNVNDYEFKIAQAEGLAKTGMELSKTLYNEAKRLRRMQKAGKLISVTVGCKERNCVVRKQRRQGNEKGN